MNGGENNPALILPIASHSANLGPMILDSFRLDGRAALITGAGRGIGLGIARGLAEAGCAVVIQDVDLAAAQQSAAELATCGARTLALGGDIRDVAAVAEMVGATAAAFGSFDILVNNAAIQQAAGWTEISAADIEAQLRANLAAPLLLCQAALHHFKAQNWGRILNIGSIQGLKGNPNMLPYSMSKAALSNLTSALARDLATAGVTVNCLAPGYFDTYRNREDFPNEAEKTRRAGKWVPLGRIGEPRDCAGIALLLCSDAGSYITGQTIFVDGGMSIR